MSRHSPYRVCPHSEVIDWPVSSVSSRLVAVVRVHSVLEKSLKMLEFGIKTSRHLTVFENT